VQSKLMGLRVKRSDRVWFVEMGSLISPETSRSLPWTSSVASMPVPNRARIRNRLRSGLLCVSVRLAFQMPSYRNLRSPKNEILLSQSGNLLAFFPSSVAAWTAFFSCSRSSSTACLYSSSLRIPFSRRISRTLLALAVAARKVTLSNSNTVARSAICLCMVFSCQYKRCHHSKWRKGKGILYNQVRTHSCWLVQILLTIHRDEVSLL